MIIIKKRLEPNEDIYCPAEFRCLSSTFLIYVHYLGFVLITLKVLNPYSIHYNKQVLFFVYVIESQFPNIIKRKQICDFRQNTHVSYRTKIVYFKDRIYVLTVLYIQGIVQRPSDHH